MSTTYISQYTASYDLSPLLAFVSNFQLLVSIQKRIIDGTLRLLNFIEWYTRTNFIIPGIDCPQYL